MSGDFNELTSQVLSQDEIESLLEQFSGDEELDELDNPGASFESDHGESNDTIIPKIDTSNLPRLNFRVPHYLKRRQLRFLEVRHDHFSRRLTDRLSLYLRKEIKADLVSFDVANYGELPGLIEEESYLAELEIDPFPVRGIFQVPIDLSLLLIDRMLGGTGEKSNVTSGLTDIEIVLMDQLLGHIMDQWAFLWEDLISCHHTISGHESEIQHLHVTSKHNPVTIATFKLRIGSVDGEIRMIFPALFWEPIMSQVSESLLASVQPKTKEQRFSNEAISKFKVNIHARWEGEQMSARDLANIEPGDFIYFNKSQADKTTIFIADLPKFMGQIGQADGKRAVKIINLIGSKS